MMQVICRQDNFILIISCREVGMMIFAKNKEILEKAGKIISEIEKL